MVRDTGRAERASTPAGEVDVVYDGPEEAPALVVLGPGAGAGLGSEFMEVLATGLAAAGLEVCRFNFAYLQAGRRSPDRQPVLEETYRAVAEGARRHASGRPLVLGGKSLGGRIASQIVAGGTPADGLAFLGYPLHPPGRPERLRAEHLKDIDLPMLFVEGTRDPFCPLPTLERVLEALDAATTVAVIDGGDHSFKLRSSSERTTRQAWEEAVAAVGAWIEQVVLTRK